jgi:hypothetical protein
MLYDFCIDVVYIIILYVCTDAPLLQAARSTCRVEEVATTFRFAEGKHQISKVCGAALALTKSVIDRA